MLQKSVSSVLSNNSILKNIISPLPSPHQSEHIDIKLVFDSSILLDMPDNSPELR